MLCLLAGLPPTHPNTHLPPRPQGEDLALEEPAPLVITPQQQEAMEREVQRMMDAL